MADLNSVFQEIAHGYGIVINGPNPWDPQIHDERTYRNIIQEGNVGLAEAYANGWWDCRDPVELCYRILTTKPSYSKRAVVPYFVWETIKKWFQNPLPMPEIRPTLDDFCAIFGKTLTYSSGYWKEAKTLDEAQDAKHDLICRKLGLQSGQTVLDVGCGWGSFAKFAAEKYGVRVVGIDLSREAIDFAREHCSGLPVEFRQMNLFDCQDRFDAIVCMGMLLHIPRRQYRKFFQAFRSCLKDQGLALLHTMGNNQRHEKLDPFWTRYQFPDAESAEMPSPGSIGEAIQGILSVEDWDIWHEHYTKTASAWMENVADHYLSSGKENGKWTEKIIRHGYHSTLAATEAGIVRVWQIVLSKDGVRGGYTQVR